MCISTDVLQLLPGGTISEGRNNHTLPSLEPGSSPASFGNSVPRAGDARWAQTGSNPRETNGTRNRTSPFPTCLPHETSLLLTQSTLTFANSPREKRNNKHHSNSLFCWVFSPHRGGGQMNLSGNQELRRHSKDYFSSFSTAARVIQRSQGIFL